MPPADLVTVAAHLRNTIAPLQFGSPVAFVYNPLDYAWDAHAEYLRRFGSAKKKVLFLGMNPGPWGMAQTGVPFGEVEAVRDWLGLSVPINRPEKEHPKRPVLGLACLRSEVSGRRLWGWAKTVFGEPESFFDDFFVGNYCPLQFLESSGRNVTPDKLSATDRQLLFGACDEALRQSVEILQPEMVVGVGAFAEARAKAALGADGPRIGRVLHPSPASPAANRGWAEEATRQLRALGLDIP